MNDKEGTDHCRREKGFVYEGSDGDKANNTYEATPLVAFMLLSARKENECNKGKQCR